MVVLRIPGCMEQQTYTERVIKLQKVLVMNSHKSRCFERVTSSALAHSTILDVASASASYIAQSNSLFSFVVSSAPLFSSYTAPYYVIFSFTCRCVFFTPRLTAWNNGVLVRQVPDLRVVTVVTGTRHLTLSWAIIIPSTQFTISIQALLSYLIPFPSGA